MSRGGVRRFDLDGAGYTGVAFSEDGPGEMEILILFSFQIGMISAE